MTGRQLDGKIALVTGGAAGLGAAIAERLAEAGANVVAGDVNRGAGVALAEIHPHRIGFRELDVREESHWKTVVDEITAQHGRLDILVNNAGIASSHALATGQLGAYHDMVAVNQTGTYLGMAAVLPHMVAARSGVIVNISSMGGLRGIPGRAAYCATKHAILGMTRSVALEVASAGVRVVAVCPGVMQTEMFGSRETATHSPILDRIPLGRIAEPSEIAGAVLFAASEDGAYCTGSEIVLDGGWTAK